MMHGRSSCSLCAQAPLPARFGAIWAKEAWGHYWTWDPKETWALLTWASYVLVIHIEERSIRPLRTLILSVLSFAVVLTCWFALDYMPAAAESVHSYTR